MEICEKMVDIKTLYAVEKSPSHSQQAKYDANPTYEVQRNRSNVYVMLELLPLFYLCLNIFKEAGLV